MQKRLLCAWGLKYGLTHFRLAGWKTVSTGWWLCLEGDSGTGTVWGGGGGGSKVLRLRVGSASSFNVRSNGLAEFFSTNVGVTEWLKWKSVGLKIQRTEVRIQSGAQEQIVRFFSESKMLC